MSEEGAEAAEFRFQTVGEQLKTARESRGLTLSEIATQTRIPMRHLEAIEKSEFSSLPGSTYTVGFTKAYVRALKLDEKQLIGELRVELAQGGHSGFSPTVPDYEPADPAHVPPRWMAWTASAIAVALVAGYFFWRSIALAPDVAPANAEKSAAVSAETAEKPAPAANQADAPDPRGAVVLTAKDTVWVRIYDADNKRLYENEMKTGDSYTVPGDANNPMIVTGRPQVLDVTVGGKAVPPLGTAERSIADVGVSAAALQARKPAAPDVPEGGDDIGNPATTQPR